VMRGSRSPVKAHLFAERELLPGRYAEKPATRRTTVYPPGAELGNLMHSAAKPPSLKPSKA
jgi:hypothetical protein